MNLPTVKIKKEILDKIIYDSKALDVLVFGVESGIFDLIGYEGMLAVEIAGELGFKPDITEALLNVYVSLGLMEKRGLNYVLTPESQEYLLKKSPLYQGEVLLMNCTHMNILSNLPKMIKGEKLESNKKMWLGCSMLKKIAQHALAGMVQNTTEFITSIDGFGNFRHMCDLGGSHGTFSMALIDRNKNLTSEIIDLPGNKDTIEEYIYSKGYKNKISATGLDLNNLEELKKTYDLALTSNVLYGWKQDLKVIFKKINKILNPGGIFVSNHFLFDDNTYKNVSASFHELVTKMCGYPSHFLSKEELVEALEKSGFGNFNTKTYEYGTMTCLLLSAQKIK